MNANESELRQMIADRDRMIERLKQKLADALEEVARLHQELRPKGLQSGRQCLN